MRSNTVPEPMHARTNNPSCSGAHSDQSFVSDPRPGQQEANCTATQGHHLTNPVCSENLPSTSGEATSQSTWRGNHPVNTVTQSYPPTSQQHRSESDVSRVFVAQNTGAVTPTPPRGNPTPPPFRDEGRYCSLALSLDKVVDIFYGDGTQDFSDWYRHFTTILNGMAPISPELKQYYMHLFFKGDVRDYLYQNPATRGFTLDEEVAELTQMFDRSRPYTRKDVANVLCGDEEDTRNFLARIRKAVSRCRDDVYVNEAARNAAILRQLKAGARRNMITERLSSATTINEALKACEAAIAFHELQEIAEDRPRSPSRREIDGSPQSGSWSKVPEDDRTRAARRATQHREAEENRRRPFSRVDDRHDRHVSGVTQSENDGESSVDEARESSPDCAETPHNIGMITSASNQIMQRGSVKSMYNPEHFCTKHNAQGHKTSECDQLTRPNYHASISGELSQPPPIFPQYPAIFDRSVPEPENLWKSVPFSEILSKSGANGTDFEGNPSLKPKSQTVGLDS